MSDKLLNVDNAVKMSFMMILMKIDIMCSLETSLKLKLIE